MDKAWDEMQSDAAPDEGEQLREALAEIERLRGIIREVAEELAYDNYHRRANELRAALEGDDE